MDTKSRILVVDDISKNLQVVGTVLRNEGYAVMPATSGPQAIERVRAQPPDLILLDLMMPEMDGIEVCQRLKADPATRQIPVIFLTASNEMEHLVKGFAARAVDYVTKPFNPPELLARVRTHLELQHARQRLREMNDEKNEFLGIAAHDLRNPLTAIEGFSEVLCDDADLTPEELKDYAGRIRESAKRMREMVQNLLDANRIERGDMQLTLAPTDVGAVLKSVMEAYRPRAAAKQQVLHLDCEVASVAAIADRNVMVQVLENLVSNAVKYSPSGRNIWIRLRKSAAAVRCEVEDEGPGFKRGRSKEALRQIRAAQRKAHRWRTSHRAGSVDRQTNGGSHAGAGLVRE